MCSSANGGALLVALVIELLLAAGALVLDSASASISANCLGSSGRFAATCVALALEQLFACATRTFWCFYPAKVRLGSDFCLDRQLCGLEGELSG